MEACKGEALVLCHEVRKPSVSTGKNPMVILLHGVGSNEKHMFDQANLFPENYIVVAARAPFKLGPGKYAWFEVQFLANQRIINEEQEAKSVQILNQFISQAAQRYGADEQQVFLIGFSQGAIMSYTMGLIRPNKIKGVVAIAGRLLDQTKSIIASKEALKQIQFLIFQGTQDTVMPMHYGNEAADYLAQICVSYQKREFPVGHYIVPEEWNDLIQWMQTC
jgi:phospholipase/carboxylesterase